MHFWSTFGPKIENIKKWNQEDRKTILNSLLKLSKTQNGIEKLFDLLGSAGAIGALFKVNCFDLLLINYSKTGSLLEQILSDDQDQGVKSFSETVFPIKSNASQKYSKLEPDIVYPLRRAGRHYFQP